LTGTLGGSASVHDGYLDAANGYEEFPIDNFVSMSSSAGCIRKRIAFTYSGASPAIQYIIQTSPNVASRVYLVHNSAFIQCYITNSGGTTIYSMVFSWTPSADTIYEFEVDWTSTHAYIFINGQLQDSDTGSLNIAEPSLFRIGGGANTAFKIYDIAVFDTLQHSSNYTPDWLTFYETIYLESSLVFPEMEHIGDGSIKLFNYLLMTYIGNLGILLEIDRSGNKLWWNGSSWVVSDGTYVQSTDLTTFNLHSTSLPVDGAKYGQFTVIFPDSNTQGSISELTANMKVNIGYSTSNPKCSNSEVIRTDAIESIEMNTSISGSDVISMTMEVDGVEKYWNGIAWASSSGYSQSNTLSEINTNISTLLDAPADVRWILYLHSENGSTTPIVPSLTVNFSFAGSEKDEIETCAVWWYMAENRTVNIFLKNDCVKYKTNVLLRREDYNYEITAGESEYCEVNLPDTENMEVDELDNEQTYVVLLDGKRYEINIPNQDGALLFDLIGA